MVITTKPKSLEKVQLTQLTPEERLADRGATFEECYKKHYKLTYFTQKKLRGVIEASGMDPDDVHQECLIGLYEAFNSYDPNRGRKFSTHAYMYMKGKVLRYFRDSHHTIRKPRTVFALERFCRDNNITQYEDLVPHYAYLEQQGIKPNNLKQLYIDTLVYSEIISTNYQSADGVSRIDETIGYNDKNFDNVDFESIIAGFKLTERDLTVLRLHLEGVKQKDIGKCIGVSQMQASRSIKALQRKINRAHIVN